MRVYRATGAICRACPAFGTCAKDRRWGRTTWIGPHDTLLRGHGQRMATDEPWSLYARRKELAKPSFGILKEQMEGRRFLLRGLGNVRAEFVLLATPSTSEHCGESGLPGKAAALTSAWRSPRYLPLQGALALPRDVYLIPSRSLRLQGRRHRHI